MLEFLDSRKRIFNFILPSFDEWTKFTFTPSSSRFQIFGLTQACHQYRGLIRTPDDQNLKSACSYNYILLRSWPQIPQVCPLGPKFFRQIFSHIIKFICYLMHFEDLFGKKWLKVGKTCHFLHFLLFHRDFIKMTCFQNFWPLFAKQINKMHKITSDFYDMRKILTKKFWSQGTSLGYLGPGSQEALDIGAC